MSDDFTLETFHTNMMARVQFVYFHPVISPMGLGDYRLCGELAVVNYMLCERGQFMFV